MNNLWFQIISCFLLGAIFFFIIEYFFYKFFEKENKIIFTPGISDNVITFTKDYQEILTAQLGEKAPYHVIHEKGFCKVLYFHWTISDIKTLIESLKDQDYAISLEYIGLDKDHINKPIDPINNPRIILSTEFIINKHSNPIIISSLISQQVKFINNIFGVEVDHYIMMWFSPLIKL
jgi:hypothetical protein